ncbi:(d)CMP kinase [Candidatus Latescibacterota bacterium]
MTARQQIVAIDGPVGSGKSTTARMAANRLGFLYIDTGAMYRAVTVGVLDCGVAPDDEETIRSLMDDITVEQKLVDGSLRTLLNDKDVSVRIRDLDVTGAVSVVSAQKAVRKRMTALQRRLGERGGVVMEGRDIGTVVFPHAEIKIYLDASIEKRAERRHRELREKGTDIPLTDLVRDIAERDRANIERTLAPLRKADDAIRLDTTDMTLDEQVAAVVTLIRKKTWSERPPTRGIPMSRLYRTARWIVLVLYRIAFRIKCTGLEHVPMEGGVIIAPNHASFFDPPSVGIILERESAFFAKKELFRIPGIRLFLSISNSIPVDRGGYNRTVLKEVVSRLKNGYAVTLFPEGTRTRTGEFLEPKSGIGMVAVMADVPIVPCWIEGSFRARPFKNRLTLHFMPPFHPSEIQAPSKKEHYLLVSKRIMYDIGKMSTSHHGRA